MPTNRERLAERFLNRLLALSPGSVLDVGCGSGKLVAACAAAGVRAEGVEPDADRVADCRAAGLRIMRGDAAPLPFPDRSFDWVTLRHVPHHLEEPRAALGEAWRVAACGVLIAEPWYDTSLPSQALALRFDLLLKRLDRRRGMFHADNLSPKTLIELLPEQAREHVEYEAFLRPRVHAPADLEADLSQALGTRDVPAEEREELQELRAAAQRGEITDNGTVILLARRGT